jgi:hypothetical protein
MGSVRDLYTTGDNDPEIEPVQSYRHYLYCDGCGSFDLQSWQARHDEARERKRRTLARVALLSSLLVMVSGWRALGLVPSLPVLAYLPVGIALLLVVRGSLLWSLWGRDEPLAARWRFFTQALVLFLVVAALDWLASELLWPRLGLLVGAIALAGSLIWRRLLDPKVEHFGLRCAQCDAAYPYGSPFFTDLEANPRGLLLGDVPRPLGVSPFEKGAYVGPAPFERPHSGIPE